MQEIAIQKQGTGPFKTHATQFNRPVMAALATFEFFFKNA